MSQESNTVLRNQMVCICQTCGHPIVFWKLGTDDWTIEPHLTCEKPTASMQTHNPRKLGVITSET